MGLGYRNVGDSLLVLMFRRSIYASSVQLGTRLDTQCIYAFVFISHELALTKACGTTRLHQRIQCKGARVLKRPQGK
jgi:hypothetical protein